MHSNLQVNCSCDSRPLSDSNKEKVKSTDPFVIPWVNVSYVQKQKLFPLRLLKSTKNSIQTCIYPQKFKNAKVIAIHKKGAKQDKANYSHISIQPIISFIFERHVSIYFFIFLYFQNNDLFYSRRSGFRAKHSCQIALVTLLDDW